MNKDNYQISHEDNVSNLVVRMLKELFGNTKEEWHSCVACCDV